MSIPVVNPMLGVGHKTGEMAACEVGDDFPAVASLIAEYDWENSALGLPSKRYTS